MEGEWEWEGEKVTYLLLVVKALVVVLKDGCAFCLARVVLGVGVGRVACEDFLPEGEAAGGAWDIMLVGISEHYVEALLLASYGIQARSESFGGLRRERAGW